MSKTHIKSNGMGKGKNVNPPIPAKQMEEELSAGKLKTEENFLRYIQMLQKFSKRYTVVFAAMDTPSGSDAFTSEISRELQAIGLRHNLYQKFRYSYAAIIDEGELIFEELPEELTLPVEYTGVINSVPVYVKSAGFQVPAGRTAIITIDGVNHSPCFRGLNIVVFDKITKFVIDAVNFDTYSEKIACRRPFIRSERLLSWCKLHPGISVMTFNVPSFPKEDLSENEKFIKNSKLNLEIVRHNVDKPIFAFSSYLNVCEAVDALTPPKSYHDMDGVRYFEDYSGLAVNTMGGHRVTCDQPDNYLRTIFIVGGCEVFGVGVKDCDTIASNLQQMCGDFFPKQKILVENYGYFLCEAQDARGEEELKILEGLPVREGDIVLCDFGYSDTLPHIEIGGAARRPHDYGEIFFDDYHYTREGYQLIAKRIFDALQQQKFFSDVFSGGKCIVSPSNQYPFNTEERKELEAYKKILMEFYDSMFSLRIGAIVMNCNPFTLGHRYLIEQALEQCHHLIVFLVQEDQSFFPFAERLSLVDKGIADLEDVTVIPSGRFMISTLTFSEYFNKSDIQERVIDSSLDVMLFAKEIAPCLDISVRFAGEEPYDNVTRQYNQTMRNVLPKYGIDFVEIPRLELDGSAVSASRVRELLKEKEFKSIARLVPKTTYDYLLENY